MVKIDLWRAKRCVAWMSLVLRQLGRPGSWGDLLEVVRVLYAPRPWSWQHKTKRPLVGNGSWLLA